MQHPHSHKPLIAALLGTMLLPLPVALGAAGSDPPIVVEEVDLLASSRSGLWGEGEAFTDVAAGAWNESTRCRLRNGSAVARNQTRWTDHSLSGTLSANGRTRSPSILNQSASLIRFTVPNRDRSMPDAGWTYGGRSPLEALYGGTPPTCTASIQCTVRQGAISGDAAYRMPAPYASAKAPKVIGLVILRSSGDPVASCLIDDTESIGSRSLSIDLELQPDEYTLIAHCGTDLDPAIGGTTASPSIEFDIAFENTGPGDGDYIVVDESERYELFAGGASASWWWTNILHDAWRTKSVGLAGASASAGGVLNRQAGGMTGFRHLRSSQAAFRVNPDAHGVNDMDITFVLPHRMDVGIGSLWSIELDQSNRTLNDGMWTMRILSLDDGTEVYRQDVTVDDVDPATGFGNAELWMNLDRGSYRLSIVGDANARSTPFGSGADLGFWHALAFEIP